MDRIERHDFVNAVLLAVVLLGMAFALVAATRALLDTTEEGLIDAESPEETVPLTPVTSPDGSTETSEPETEEETTSTAPARLPSEVQVRVGNGAGKSGVAGRATDILSNAGYAMLGAKNSTVRLDTTTVYYIEGYSADAEVVAQLLNTPVTNIAPMPPDPGVALDTAAVIVILGADTTL